MLAPAVAHHLFETLLESETRPAGAASYEITSVEACIPAYQPDLEVGLSPAESDLDVFWGIPGEREERIRSALLIEGTGVLSPGTPVTLGADRVGELRTCVHSSALDATIGMAILDMRHAHPGLLLHSRGAKQA